MRLNPLKDAKPLTEGSRIAQASRRRCAPAKGRSRIVFFGHFGWANFGNEGTLQAMLCCVRSLLPDSEFCCICTEPTVVAADYEIGAVPSRRSIVTPFISNNTLFRVARKIVVGVPSELYRWLRGFQTLWDAKVLIVPGTGILNDAYGLFGWGPYDLFRWSLTAKLCRCRVLFVSVGAGPIYSRAGRFFVKTALSLADFRSYRDESSREYLKGIGFWASADPVSPDLAFSLPPAVIPRGGARQGRRPVVGLGLMEYAGKYGVEKPANAVSRTYLETLVEFTKWLLAHEYDVRLVIGDLVDVSVRREFKTLLRERGVMQDEGRVIDEPVASFGDVLSQIAGTDFMVATRFHNLLFSLLLNKPLISISFHHKCASLMAQMGLSEYCLDINNLKPEELIAHFLELEQNEGRLKAMIQENVENRRKALDEQYRVIFSRICPDGEQPVIPAAETRRMSTVASQGTTR